MFKSWNKITQILNNLQADQELQFKLKLQLKLQFICFVWNLFTNLKKHHFIWVSMYLARKN